MYGFSETFDNVLTINNNIFVNQFKTRVIDTYKSEWFASIESYSVLDMYKIYKPLHGYEFYLDIIPRSLRLFLINSICTKSINHFYFILITMLIQRVVLKQTSLQIR